MSAVYEFGPFRLEVAERRLLRQGRVVPLRPKVFDTLCALVARHDHLVTKDELISLVWPDTIVEENNLALSVAVLRKALRAAGAADALIETVSGKGYRFTAPVREAGQNTRAPGAPFPPLPRALAAPALIERESELQALRTSLERAQGGHRQLVVLFGEAGIGKTALADRFLLDIETLETDRLVGRGQAVEHVGAGEAYMPVLDALGRMCREAAGVNVAGVLARNAPSWLVQLPALVGDDRLTMLQERALGSTPERMVRELAETLERLGEHRLVVLALEDLHWSDPSTVSLIAALARRQEPARLLMLATCRSDDAGSGRAFGTLAQELELRGHCRVMRLPSLSPGAIARVAGERLPGFQMDPALAALVHRRTSGNPLFAHALVDYWRQTGAVRLEGGAWQMAASSDAFERGTPETLRAMLERKLDALSPDDEELLECASVIGTQFCSALLACIAGRDVEEVETRCASLVGALLGDEGICTWPDGTVAGEYGFAHALYQEVLYERVPPIRRARLHLAVGRRLEEAFRGRTHERASELAHHFAAGREAATAVHYSKLAAENALRRSAHREAAAYLRRALALLPDDAPDRLKTEFQLHGMLAPTALALEGFASREAERSFLRARELGNEIGDAEKLSPLLFGLAMMHELRGDFPKTQALLTERLQLRCAGGKSADVESETLMACSLFHQGRFAAALEHAVSGARLYEPSRHLALMAAYGENAGVACLSWSALCLWFLGQPDTAVNRIDQAVALSEAPGHLYSLSAARAHGAHIHQLRRDVARTREWAEQTLGVSSAQGYLYYVAFAQVLLGWTRALEGEAAEGLALMQEGLARHRSMGAQLDLPYMLALVAEAEMAAGLQDRARSTLDEALVLVRHSRTFFYEAELLRLQAALDGSRAGSGDACLSLLQRAMTLAQRQGAKSLELRAALDLARIMMDRGTPGDARQLLQRLYGAFVEGHASADLVEARRLLECTASP
jgi:DNA-binding winged helix-turn-helix (wHTH) protein/predicted ATPase